MPDPLQEFYPALGSIGVMDSTQHYGCWNEGSNPSWSAIKTKGVYNEGNF